MRAHLLIPAIALAILGSSALAQSAYDQGKQLYQQGRYQEAIAQFEAAARQKPRAKVYWNKALAELKIGAAQAALASMDQARALDPKIRFTDSAKFWSRYTRAKQMLAPAPTPGTPGAPAYAVPAVPGYAGPPPLPLPPVPRPVVVVHAWPAYYYVFLVLGILVALGIIGQIVRRIFW